MICEDSRTNNSLHHDGVCLLLASQPKLLGLEGAKRIRAVVALQALK